MDVTKTLTNKAFGCTLQRFKHVSPTLGGLSANFHVILPPGASPDKKVPLLIWLSGLTCTDENFTIKAGAFQWCARYNVAIATPDTSPRGAGIATEDDSWDFGTGAGFYVNATQEPWSKHYRMFDYVNVEFPKVLAEAVGDTVDLSRVSIFGHSMGGHGALISALKNPGKYYSVSAFAPICHPTDCPWGKKCFSNYLGESPDASGWAAYDATELLLAHAAAAAAGPIVKSGERVLVDQGADDSFLEQQLKPGALEAACKKAGVPVR
mmetsp:Transcript_15047/g.38495  ORF Transcript_15047/g.38495 Transcript_15047/m.38495 type:complete len:266 (-) Transcript_15047:444-1241(-)